MTPKDNPRDDDSPDGSAFDLERLLARYELKISQIRLDVPDPEMPQVPERSSPPLLDLPPPPPKKSYFEGVGPAPAPPPKASPPPQLGPIEPPKPPAAPPSPAVPAAPWGRRKKTLVFALAAAVPLTGLLLWRAKTSRAPVPHAFFPVPLGHMMGLLAKEGKLLTVDTDKQALVTMAPETGKILSREKFPNPSLRGVAWGQDSFWSSDLESGFIYRHGPREPHALINAFATSRSFSVLYHDGRSLWASDIRSELVYRYSLAGKGSNENLARQAEYPLPGIVVGGFHQAGGVLWVLDSLSRKVRRYRIEPEGLSLLDSADLSSWLAPNSEIAGFAVEDDRLWLIADNPAALHRFAHASLSWTPEKKPLP